MELAFNIGTPVVHPIHGAGRIKSITSKIILQEERQYYVIELPNNELSEVMVPVANAKNVGLRNVNSPDKLENVLTLLKTPETPEEDNMVKSFYQRYREFVAKVQSGNLFDVAIVYKLLHFRSLIKPLGMKDKSLYEMAEHLLASEMIFSMKLTRDAALGNLRDSLTVHGIPVQQG